MASTCATNATNQQERIAFLKKQIDEEEHKILLALQAETRRAHEDYKNTFDKLMKSTNGQILNRLQIFPTIVTHLSQSIANRNVNDYVFASNSAIKGLLMTSLQTVMMGIEDLYDQGEMFLSGDELEKFGFSKKEKDAELERHRLEIQAMVDKIVFLEAQLADVEEKSRKKNVSEKNSSVKKPIAANLAELREDCEAAVIKLEGHIIYLLRNQFNFMFFQFERLVDFDSPLMKPFRDAHGDSNSTVTKMHLIFNKLPENIDASRRTQLVKELTAGVSQLRQTYDNGHKIFLECTGCAITALDPNLPSYSKKENLERRAQGMKALIFDFEEFDCRVAWAHAEMQRYRDEISKLDNQPWDEEILADAAKDADEHKEKLVQELITLRRGRCSVIDCDCIEREKRLNAVMSGVGTQMRNKYDREMVEELLAGSEPWKEEMEEFEERRVASCPRCQEERAQASGASTV
ncbi:uncharacterized protein K444DRAFT_628954 [Hyaloscypha bicolor E]|uniref:Uncharacterized protein n=1 Tax=Hyaloscypha bicolor E TaxID=1095630 RepID=A0A2J6TD23_9HELO|nr:uncharacterized protein K444DRAFT_628954 [Hyaloscypha bicolor E]PMD60927.1 hypothetical protein K444DRAFT_628954 [Hyaloscypha bicolor E]